MPERILEHHVDPAVESTECHADEEDKLPAEVVYLLANERDPYGRVCRIASEPAHFRIGVAQLDGKFTTHGERWLFGPDKPGDQPISGSGICFSQVQTLSLIHI